MMRNTKSLSRALLMGMLFAVLFGCIAYLVSEQRMARFDRPIISYIQGFESPFWTAVMKGFTFIGSNMMVTILSLLVMGFLYTVLHHRMEVVLFIVVVAGSAGINLLLKSLFHRPRPVLHRIIDANGYSFPSGHSMVAVALYSTLAFLLWRHLHTRFTRLSVLILSTCFILAIGISRIYLGVHYPSDVVGGYLASGCWLSIAIWIYQSYMERQTKKDSSRIG